MIQASKAEFAGLLKGWEKPILPRRGREAYSLPALLLLHPLPERVVGILVEHARSASDDLRGSFGNLDAECLFYPRPEQKGRHVRLNLAVILLLVQFLGRPLVVLGPAQLLVADGEKPKKVDCGACQNAAHRRAGPGWEMNEQLATFIVEPETCIRSVATGFHEWGEASNRVGIVPPTYVVRAQPDIELILCASLLG
jgi:hypothetical protein